MDAHTYHRLLSGAYEWQTEHMLDLDSLPTHIVTSLEAVANVHRALQNSAFAHRPVDSLLAGHPGDSTMSDEPLQLGYSNSIMCTTFHVADYENMFQSHGLQVQAGKRRVADRIARLVRIIRRT